MSLGTLAGSRSYLPQTPLAPLIPRRQGYPLVGVLPELRRDPLNFFVETVREWGDLVELPLGSERIVMVNRPDYIRHVLQEIGHGFLQGTPNGIRLDPASG